MPRGRRSRSGGAGSSSASSPKRRRHHYNTRSRSRRDRALGNEMEGRKPVFSDEDFCKRIDNVLAILSEGKALGVTSVEDNRASNTDAHRTSEYETEDLVVRRGMPFDLTITFDRDINTIADILTLQFTVGARPKESKGTLVRLKLDLENRSKVIAHRSHWAATVSSHKDNVLEVAVCPPANSVVGYYTLWVESRLLTDGEDAKCRYQWQQHGVTVIFNPWCAEDVCYLEDERQREEYVLNDKGRIWVGSSRAHRGRPWNFGQFDDICLDAALFLLDRAELGDSARRSPISVVRAISALVNSNDDDGVLEGKWGQPYPKGTVPWAWVGSVNILTQFMRTRQPVKYGQCWVFSGVTTTLLRALGIATRSVTNFESAHDCDASMTIDTHFDHDDEAMDELNDSVWNFHVWNECWFRRLDLPDGYDGWQALDATPQECSEGVMRCGPAPLAAIKKGHVWLNYDIPFVFSEVNGDRVTWQHDEHGDMEVIKINPHAVGKFISTKSVGSNERHDLTSQYKFPEGSEEERRVVQLANRFSKLSPVNIYKTESKEYVTFDMQVADVMFGQDIVVTLTIKNKSEAGQEVTGRISLLSAFYTGVPGKRLKGEHYSLQLEPGKEEVIEQRVSAKEYQSKLNDEAAVQLNAVFRVAGTKQHFVHTENFALEMPSLEITVADNVTVGEEVEAIVSFTNPLTINLTNATLTLEGSSLMTPRQYNFSKPIKAGETVSQTFDLCPRRPGQREIEASLTSDQLSGVDGSLNFTVSKAEAPMESP